MDNFQGGKYSNQDHGPPQGYGNPNYGNYGNPPYTNPGSNNPSPYGNPGYTNPAPYGNPGPTNPAPYANPGSTNNTTDGKTTIGGGFTNPGYNPGGDFDQTSRVEMGGPDLAGTFADKVVRMGFIRKVEVELLRSSNLPGAAGVRHPALPAPRHRGRHGCLHVCPARGRVGTSFSSSSSFLFTSLFSSSYSSSIYSPHPLLFILLFFLFMFVQPLQSRVVEHPLTLT